MYYILWAIASIWLLSAVWIIKMIYRDWYEVEEQVVKEDPLANALGCIPPFIKWTFACWLFILGPFEAVPDMMAEFKEWWLKRRVIKALDQVNATLGQFAKDDPELVAFMKKKSEEIKELLESGESEE